MNFGPLIFVRAGIGVDEIKDEWPSVQGKPRRKNGWVGLWKVRYGGGLENPY